MGGHHVRAVGRSRTRPLQSAPFAERCEEPGRAIGVIAGAGQVLDPDLVGFEFLLAREGGDRQFRARLDLLVGPGVFKHLGVHAREQGSRFLEFRPLRGMAGGDMRNLVRHDRGDFGRVVSQREKSAGDEYVPRREGESIDDRRIQHGDAIGLSGPVRRRGQPVQDAAEVGLGCRRMIFAAECLHQPPALGIRRSARRMLDRDWRRRDAGARWGVNRRAGGQPQAQRASGEDEDAPPNPCPIGRRPRLFDEALTHGRGLSTPGASGRRIISIIAGSRTSSLG